MIKKLFALILIVSFALPACAEVVRVGLDDAVATALQYNLDLQAKRKELGIAQANIKIANALKNPQFQSNFLVGKVREGNSNQFGLLFPVQILKRGPKKRVATAEMKIAQDKIKAYEHEVKINVMEAYFNVLYLKSVVKILTERKNLFENMVKITDDLPKEAKNFEIDNLQADIKFKKQVIELNKAKAQLLSAQFALNKAINQPNQDFMYDTEETSLFSKDLTILNIELPPYEMVEKVAMKYSHSIRIESGNISRLEYAREVARSMVIPDLYVGGGYAWQGNYDGKGNYWPGAYVAAFADVPIFYTYGPERQAAAITLEKAKMDKLSFENKLKIILKQEYNNFKFAKANMEFYKEILAESDRILRLSTERYIKNETQLVSLLVVENSHQEILNEYITAMEFYYMTYLALMRNMGHDVLLEEDIFED